MPHTIARKPILPVCLIACLALILAPAWAGQRQDGGRRLETAYSTISYHREADLLGFGRKLGKGQAALIRDNARAAETAREEVDRLVYHVRTLLDMHPPLLRFNIIVLSDYNEIRKAYASLGFDGPAPIAFYRQRSQTIYVSVDKLTPGVLAHEVAHAVINAFFSTPPPAQMQEILAQYVDRHLGD